MARPKIPKELKYRIMYDSQYVCAICQKRACHIHHIDENHSNNCDANLIFLCNTHHDEAHTKRQLSQNLGPDALRDAKPKWTEEVKKKRDLAATVSGQLLIANSGSWASIGLTWGYINHKRVAQLAKPALLGTDEKQYFEYCRQRGIIDQGGILIKPTNARSSKDYIRNSVYDWYEFGDDQRLHRVYTAFVDQISSGVRPIHLENENWTKANILELTSPGDFIFLNRAFFFKSVKETRTNQHRRVMTFRRKVSVEFYVDTMDMLQRLQ